MFQSQEIDAPNVRPSRRTCARETSLTAALLAFVFWEVHRLEIRMMQVGDPCDRSRTWSMVCATQGLRISDRNNILAIIANRQFAVVGTRRLATKMTIQRARVIWARVQARTLKSINVDEM